MIGDEIRLRLPMVPGYGRIARITASNLALRLGFAYPDIEDLRIAVDEAVILLLRTADGAPTIRVVFRVIDDGLAIDLVSEPPVEAPVAVPADGPADGPADVPLDARSHAATKGRSAGRSSDGTDDGLDPLDSALERFERIVRDMVDTAEVSDEGRRVVLVKHRITDAAG